MATDPTAIQIINDALMSIGALPVGDIDGTGPAGKSPASVYNRVLLDITSKYPWHFTMTTRQLARETAAPVRGWAYAYGLPAGRVALPRAYYDSKEAAFDTLGGRPLTRYSLAGRLVETDAAEVWASYQALAPSALWPGYYRELIVLALSAEYALTIREDRQLRDQLRRDAYGDPRAQGAGGQMDVAMALDAQAAPQKPIDGGRNPVHDAGYAGTSDIRDDWAY